MKKILIGSLIKAMKSKNTYSNEELEVIQYGLESIYILITKLIIIGILAYLMGIFYEFVIFLLIYNIIRTPSFGLHATKSWICLIVSSFMFLITPIIAANVELSIYFKSIIGSIALLFIYKNAPADTEKRPIISQTRRLFYKYISVIVTVIMLVVSITARSIFIGNSFFWAVILQCFMISPTVYELFGLSHDNYLKYQNSLNTF